MIEELRDEFDNMFDYIVDKLNDLDIIIQKYESEEIDSIKNVNNFISKLDQDNLYTEELRKFINDYMRYYNN